MSDPAEPAPAKPKRSLVKLAGLGVVMAGMGGGATYGLYAAGVIGAHAPEKVDHNPQLVRKGEADPYAPPPSVDAKDAEGGEEEEEGSGGSEYRIAYYSFADEFTSNLQDSDGLVQLSLAASTRRDGRVLRRLARHELAIRSAVLVVLADTPEPGIDTVEGKARLQKRLTAAINEVLTRNEGFGGVDAVYFKSFLVQ